MPEGRAVGLPELLDVDQAADLLNTTPRHVRRLVAERRLAHFKVGRKVRISRAELAAWLDRQRVDAAS